jgi:hypothetical protein
MNKHIPLVWIHDFYFKTPINPHLSIKNNIQLLQKKSSTYRRDQVSLLQLLNQSIFSFIYVLLFPSPQKNPE